uniref:hypothetical protein n=1 Tax=Trichocoleus desertorum TaxID=1481672 RepID=UPI0025B3B180|nr:hypothetical protein [Trichocoleus desertorum]
MQITVDLPPDLEDLVRQAALSNIPLQTLILQALRQLTQNLPVSQWSDVVFSYQEISEFPTFESYRDEFPSTS